MLLTKKHKAHDFELNLTPIIDCFVTLICFMLLSATYVNLTGMEAKVPIAVPASAAKINDTKEKFKVDLNVNHKSIELLISGAGNLSGKKSFALGDPLKPDLKLLHQELVKLKKTYPKEYSITFNAETEMNYDVLIKYMDSTRNLYPEDGAIDVVDERNGKPVKMDVLFPDFIIAGLGASAKGEKMIHQRKK